MARKPQPAWQLYEEQMECHRYGHALWEPAPTRKYTRISIGDVGYIRQGRFHLLFSAGIPLGERKRGVDVPNTFEPLECVDETTDEAQPRGPCCVAASTSRQVGASLDATIPTLQDLEPSENFSFELIGDRGAALTTSHRTYNEDSQLDTTFKKYTIRHYKSWVKFARDKGYGENLRPVLVSGFDMTKDFAIMAYSYNRNSDQSDKTFSNPMFGSAPASPSMFDSAPASRSWTWRTACSTNFKHGPQQRRPPSSSRSSVTESLASGFNQCVFIRYYTMRFELGLFPRVIRAGAGPHDLGSGETGGETFPELIVRSDAGPMSVGEDHGEQWDLATNDAGSEMDIVVRNVPYDEGRDNWDLIADYVFQNSKAKSVLMHHKDLAGIRALGDESDISYLLKIHRPRIVVDEDGVGGIIGGAATPDGDLGEIDFISLGSENLLSLGEDFMRALPSVTRDPPRLRVEEGLVDLISETVERHGTSQTSLPLQDATELADTFRQALLRLHLSDSSMRDLWIRLYVHALLRGSYIFTDVQFPGPSTESPVFEPFGFVDVWKGQYHGNPVCIKFIRTRDKVNLQKIKKIFYQGGQVCKNFSHPNIVPVFQVSKELFPFCIMSPWMPGGNIMQYTQKNPSANRLMLLAEVCHGLSHLHGLNIPHGCISPNNILITRDGRACLGDFGVVEGFGELPYTRFKLGTMRYMAVERLDPTGGSVSKKSDIYSLAMTSFTVLTGITPYDEVRGHYTLIVRIKSGERPSRPTNLDGPQSMPDNVWGMITTCWSEVPEQRWEVSAICELFWASSLQEIQKIKTDIRTGGKKRGSKKLRSQLASLYEFLWVSEPEIRGQVDGMDQRLENQMMSDRERRKLLNELCETCSQHRVIPNSMNITECPNDATEVERVGWFSNVSRTTYGGYRVAIKAVDVCMDLKATRSGFCREVVAWKHFRHPNILPLLGVIVEEGRFAVVYKWMDNGNVTEFVRRDPDANRTALLADVANGLKYVHDLDIVHGDLKGANILINKDRRACITDFNLTTITGAGVQTFPEASPTSTILGVTLMPCTPDRSCRWMSPELLKPYPLGIPESERPTSQSDCYALGMVIYEVLSGLKPYHEIQGNYLVMNAVLEGVRPKKPEGATRLGFNDELWTIVEQCWRGYQNERPGVEEILSCLNEATAFWYTREL